jgi:hypothetical protein
MVDETKESLFGIAIDNDYSDYEFEEEASSYLPRYTNFLSMDFNLITSPDSISEKYTASRDRKDFLINEFRDLVAKRKILYFPIYKMDHSYVTYSIHEFGGIYGYFDSGQVGFIYITEANAKKLIKAQTLGPKEKEEVEKLIENSFSFINEFYNRGYTDIVISYKGDPFFNWTGLLLAFTYKETRQRFIKEIYDSFKEQFDDKSITFEDIEEIFNKKLYSYT